MQEEAAPKDSASKSEANSKSQTMLSLQNKIQSQAKRLCSMQDYITTLESTIKEHKINSNKKSQKESLIQIKKINNIIILVLHLFHFKQMKVFYLQYQIIILMQ